MVGIEQSSFQFANSNFSIFAASPDSRVHIKILDQPKQQVKRCVAETVVAAPPDIVWKVLTHYERLPEFVPNLEECRRVAATRPGHITLIQRACSQSALWRLEASALLEIEELSLPLGRKEARFRMLQGDFKELSGCWVVEPDPSSSSGQSSQLRYDILIVPQLPLPSSIVSYIVKAGLPANIKAVVKRAEQLAKDRLKLSGPAVWAGAEEDPPLPSTWEDNTVVRLDELQLPAKGSIWPAGFSIAASPFPRAPPKRRPRESSQSTYLGVSSIPLPPAIPPEESLQKALEIAEPADTFVSSYPEFGLRKGSTDNVATEVHLRRLDCFDQFHRRAVAAIAIDAPLEMVWKVITDYDSLADFIPNLASSKQIILPDDAPSRVIRLRQVGFKRMPYMCFHAESVLDLVERPHSEIQFRQVSGTFEQFQGKWMLQEANSMGTATLLKYAVEIVAPRGSARLVNAMEPLLEALVFEDIPANLDAIKRRCERQADEAMSFEESESSGRHRPRVSDMIDNFELLQSELESCFRDTCILPSRVTLRDLNRTDLEKAITAHGGRGAVAERLGWQLQTRSRKPRGYWDSLPNVAQEISEFIQERSLEPGVMPLKNDFLRAGRNDIARAIESWGGLYSLAAELGYSTQGGRSVPTEWNQHISEVAASTGLSGKQGLFKLAAETYRRSMDEESESEGECLSPKLKGKKNTALAKMRSVSGNKIRQEIDEW